MAVFQKEKYLYVISFPVKEMFIIFISIINPYHWNIDIAYISKNKCWMYL